MNINVLEKVNVFDINLSEKKTLSYRIKPSKDKKLAESYTECLFLCSCHCHSEYLI